MLLLPGARDLPDRSPRKVRERAGQGVHRALQAAVLEGRTAKMDYLQGWIRFRGK